MKLDPFAAIILDELNRANALKYTSQEDWPDVERAPLGMKNAFKQLQRRGLLRDLPEWFQQRVERMLHTLRTESTDSLMELTTRETAVSPPYVKATTWSDYPSENTKNMYTGWITLEGKRGYVGDWNYEDPNWLGLGKVRWNKYAVDFSKGDEQVNTNINEIGNLRADVDQMIESIKTTQSNIRILEQDAIQHDANAQEVILLQQELLTDMQSQYDDMMTEWTGQTNEFTALSTTSQLALVDYVDGIENSVQRDNFNKLLQEKISSESEVFLHNLGPGGLYGGELDGLFDAMDQAMEVQMSELDAWVQEIEAYLMSGSRSSMDKLQTMSTQTAPAVRETVDGSVAKVRSIGGQVARAKGKFLKEIAKIMEFIHEGAAKNMRLMDQYTGDLINRIQVWKSQSEKSTADYFRRFRKAIAKSKKVFKKTEKSYVNVHKRELQNDKKTVMREISKGTKFLRRQAKVARKEIKLFNSRTTRLGDVVEAAKDRLTEAIQVSNTTVDETYTKIQNWLNQLSTQKTKVEDAISAQVVELYHAKTQEVLATIKQASQSMKFVEKSMQDQVARQKKRFFSKLQSQEEAMHKTWEFIVEENVPLDEMNARLKQEGQRIADDQERANYLESTRTRVVDQAGKQATRSSYGFVQKARDFDSKMISEFKTNLADDRENFLNKVTTLQQNAVGKSILDGKEFSRWITGQTSTMEGSLGGLEETFHADNSGLVAKRLVGDLSSTEGKLKVLKSRFQRSSGEWVEGTNSLRRALSSAVSEAMQVATSLATETEQDLAEQIAHVKAAALRKLALRRKFADAAVDGVADLADSSEKNWMSKDKEQEQVISRISSDLQKVERKTGHFAEEVSGKEKDLEGEVETLQNNADELKTTSIEHAKGRTSAAKDELTSVVDGLLKEKKEYHVQQQAEAQQKWTRLTVTLPGKVKELNSRLSKITSDQQQRVSDLTREGKKLNLFADSISQGGKMNAYQFLKGFDEISNAAVDLWSKVEKGSDDERELVKAQLEQMRDLMGDSLGELSEKTQKEMEFEIALMNDKLAAIMANEELTETERQEALQRIQDETRVKLAQMLSKDAELTPLVEQYMSDVSHARELEARELSEESDVAKAFGTERVLAAQQNAEASKKERKYALQVVQRALREEGQDASAAENDFTEMNADDVYNAGIIDQFAKDMDNDVRKQLASAYRTSEEAKAQAGQHVEFGKSILNRERSLMKDTKNVVEKEANMMKLGVQGEQLKESMGLLRMKDKRKDFVNELSFIVEDAGNISADLLEKRVSRLREMGKEMDFAFQALRDSGHKEFADETMKSLNMAKLILTKMISMKLKVYEGMRINGEVAEAGHLTEEEFADLRQQLLTQAAERDAKSSELEAALRKKLEKMGSLSSISAEHLSAFLHQLSFQLANGDQKGFEDLLEDMKKQFGFSIEAGDGVHALLRKTMGAFEMKESASKDMLRSVHHKLDDVVNRFESARGRITKHLSKEAQLATLTTEELAERTRQLKALVARLSAWQSEPNPGALLQEADGNSLELQLVAAEAKAKHEETVTHEIEVNNAKVRATLDG